MQESTVVAVYKTSDTAAAAVRELESSHVPADSISRHSTAGSYRGETKTAPDEEKGFWASIFGSDEHADHARYDRQVKGGNCIVTVRTPNDKHAHISAILERHDPIDIDIDGALATPNTPLKAPLSATGTAENGKSDDQTMKLSEERLTVGKRAMTDGTTRVRRYVTDTPVEKTISLHNEKVTLDRRPVEDGEVTTNPDFTEKSFSMTESHEEAVVAKDARVVEEILLRKEGNDKDQTVKDTVRKHEVEIDKGDGKMAAAPTPNDERHPVPGKSDPVQTNRTIERSSAVVAADQPTPPSQKVRSHEPFLDHDRARLRIHGYGLCADRYAERRRLQEARHALDPEEDRQLAGDVAAGARLPEGCQQRRLP